MSAEMNVTLHEIATDGLPDMDTLTNRVAFIFDGCIVSGWPLSRGRNDPDGRRLWEGNRDVAHNQLFTGVTHWVEFPRSIAQLEAAKRA